jgi:streptogrisin D
MTMQSRRTLINHAAVGMILAALVMAPAQPAAAAIDEPSPTEVDRQRTALTTVIEQPSELWRTQERLDLLIEDIRAASNVDSTGGFSGAVVDAERNKLSLYWHGTVPPEVSARVDEARADGIEVAIASAPYTEAALLREADRISRMPLFQGARTGQRMMRVGPRPDGSGLDVGISGLPAGVDAAQARELVPALESTVPLAIGPMNPVSFASRLFDFPAFWGGSYIARRIDATRIYECTSAFGVTGLNGAATYLITAAHCGAGTWGSAFFRDANGNIVQDVYGSTIAAGRNTGRDVQLILTPGGAGGHVYWGAPINPPNGDPGSLNGAPVGGDSANNVNDSVCLSGSFSGTICEDLVRIAQTNLTITIDPPVNGVGRITNLASAVHIGGRTLGIVGNGDSGGPVVSVRSDGKLLARGVISAMELGLAVRPCQGYNPPGRTCSSIVYFADLRGGMNAVGVRINTA